MAYVTTRDGANLYLKDWGSGRPVILIHGWPLSADSWDAQAMALAGAGYRVLAYDRRGFGRSEQTWDGYDYNELADDLADVITSAGAVEATLVGFSMGGGEVVRYMARHQGRHVAQIALISSVVPFLLKTPDNPEGVDQSTFDGMAAAMRDDRAHFFGGFFKDFYGVGLMSQPVSDELLGWSRTVAMQASLKATLACAEAFATTDFRSDLRRVAVPTLIVHGTSDQTVPIDASGRAATRGIPQAQLKEYDGAPHGLFATHRDQLTSDLLEFVRQVPSEGDALMGGSRTMRRT